MVQDASIQKSTSENITRNQDRKIGFFLPALLILMGSYPPLATDMYLPALPQMAANFNTSDSTASLTLVLFFVFFAFSTLFWGPVSEKYGRKPSLIAGILLFTLASAGCIVSATVYQMIIWRVIQAIASGAPLTISLAIVQDTYTGDAKKKILAILGALVMVVPIVGPSLGSAILVFGQWRLVFVLLTLLGLISLVGVFFILENRAGRNDLSLFRVFSGLFSVLKNSFFSRALLLFSIPSIYIFGFIGGSAVILMKEFGVSASTFSLLFALNAGAGILGPVLFVALNKRLSFSRLAFLTFLTFGISGILIATIGLSNPLLFILCVIPGSAAASLQRPLAMDPMMEAAKENSGAASSVINFFGLLVGSIGMRVISLEWDSRALAFGIMAIFIAVFCCPLFPWMLRAMPKSFR